MAKSTKRTSSRAKAVTDEAIETVQDVVEDAVIVEDESVAAEVIEEVVTEPVEEIAEPARQKSTFLPLLLGGAIAAGLGFGAATYIWSGSNDTDLALTRQGHEIAALQAQISALPAMPDLTPLESQISETQSRFEQALAMLDAKQNETMNGLLARVEEIEKRPSADGTLAEGALAAYEREMATLRADIEAQNAEMQSLAQAANEQLSQTRDTAAQIEQNAQNAADNAVRRAALSKIEIALDMGTPFAEALADFPEAPPALSSAANRGVPTLAALIESFDDAAKAALATARAEGVSGEEGGGVGAFLRSQFDVRSIEAREGDTADAVLSRVQSALAQNHLTDALAEVESLPEVARAEMSDWIGAATARAHAFAAVETLAQSLNEN